MKRESNFEVLRTIAMFFIVVYHCLTHGVGEEYGFSLSHPISLSNVLFSDLMLVLSSIAVNLYVMISGYFLSDLNFKPSRIVRIWISACFYSCAITLVFMFLSIIPFNIISMGKCCFPISTDAYWFVTQFIGMLLLSPFLAMIVRQLSYHQYIFLLFVGAFLCLSIIPDFPLAKRFHVAHGNSVWSFAYLFLVAGFIKHHLTRFFCTRLLLLTILMCLLLLGCELYMGYQNDYIHLYWFDYNGIPFVLSVLVFIFVRQLKVPESMFWNFLVRFAPYSFGVYLIHDHLLVRDWLWSTISLSNYCDRVFFPFIVIGLCFALFVICAIIDALRKRSFALLRIDNLIVEVDKWAS